MRTATEKRASRARIRYMSATSHYAEPRQGEWERLSIAEQVDRRDRAFTARDVLRGATDEWDAERGHPQRRYWWDGHGGPWPRWRGLHAHRQERAHAELQQRRTRRRSVTSGWVQVPLETQP